MRNQHKYITLYPSHWLYNAGVIGLVNLDRIENINEISFKEGNISIPFDYFDKINTEERFFAADKTLGVSIVGKSPLYPNFINPSRKQDKEKFYLFIKSLKRIKNNGKVCGVCSNKFEFSKTRLQVLNKVWNSQKKDDFDNFFESTTEFSNQYNADIGGAISKFPNGFWNLDSTMHICPICSLILIHHHLSISQLAWHSQIFINTPSFELMFHLNKFIKELMGKTSGGIKDKREILAMSVIEYATKIKTTLGIWSGMNIEIISKTKVKLSDSNWDERIQFYSLPDDVISLLIDRKIAGQLSSIGEFKILNLVLDRKFENIVEIGYRLLRESMTSKRNFKYINDVLFLDKNKINLTETANQIFKLYALIKDKYQLKQKSFSYG